MEFIVIHILQIKRWGHAEVEYLAQDHPASQGRAGKLTQEVWLQNCVLTYCMCSLPISMAP